MGISCSIAIMMQTGTVFLACLFLVGFWPQALAQVLNNRVSCPELGTSGYTFISGPEFKFFGSPSCESATFDNKLYFPPGPSSKDCVLNPIMQGQGSANQACADSLIGNPSIEKLVIIAHGFTEHRQAGEFREMREAIFAKESTTAILALGYKPKGGWQGDAPGYVAAGRVARYTGAANGLLVNHIKQSMGSLTTHCIGFSLGGQTCSFVGKTLKEVGNPLDRITGLDSAGMFYWEDAGWLWGNGPVPENIDNTRLNSGDAKLVDWYHTDAGNQGTGSPSGTVNFYLGSNGQYGSALPGCETNGWGLSACNHFTTPYFLIETIKNKNQFTVNQKCSVKLQSGVFVQDCAPTSSGPTVGYFIEADAQGEYTVDIGNANDIVTEDRMAMWYGYTDAFVGEWTKANTDQMNALLAG